MATIREFVESKLAQFGITPALGEMDVWLAQAEVADSEEYNLANLIKAKTVLLSAIPELLLQADITEGGYSLKWDKSGIRAYYSLLCKELGLPDSLTPATATLTDKSYLW